MEIKGFITNLGKYNEGYLIGKWITFPIDDDDLEKVLEEIGINERYEEYFFTDYENNIFNFGEYSNISEINEIVERFDVLCEENDEEIVVALCDYYNDIDDVENSIDNIYTYWNVNDMEDVAREYVEETGYLQNIPDNIAQYFDYESFGRDMSFDGTWIWFGKYNENVVEYLESELCGREDFSKPWRDSNSKIGYS